MNFRNVVVGLDLSASSLEALSAARLLAQERVVLVHATEVRPFDLINAAAALEAERLHEELARRARAELERLATSLASTGITTEVVVGSGRAVDEILQRSVGADLAIVGSHGRGALGRLLLGSVAEELARRSSVPTLVVRHASAGGWMRVVLALDPLGPARDAIRAAALVARRMNAPLEVLHSVHFPTIMPSGAITGVSLDDDPAFARARGVLQQHLTDAPSQIRRLVHEVAGTDATVHVFVGQPRDEIPRRLRPDDLLVCGTHGRTGAARFFFGSVAGKLLHQAPCSVLVVPPHVASPSRVEVEAPAVASMPG